MKWALQNLAPTHFIRLMLKLIILILLIADDTSNVISVRHGAENNLTQLAVKFIIDIYSFLS